MNITRDQAAGALKDIETVAAQSQALKHYAIGAPIFMMWGVICMVGYGAGAVSPAYSFIWTPLSLLGGLATYLLVRRAKCDSPALNRSSPRIGWTWLAVLVFYVATFAVLRPHEPNQFAAFPALIVALSYALMGIWTWPRYLVLGAAVAAATLLGYFLLAPYFSVWMAFVMGGGLVLGGLWLRKV
jgi:hypothetical protein